MNPFEVVSPNKPDCLRHVFEGEQKRKITLNRECFEHLNIFYSNMYFVCHLFPVPMRTQWNSTFLHFHWLKRAPQKRCCNLKCLFRHFTNKILVSYNKKCIFEHYREFQTIRNPFIDITLAMKRFFGWPFQSSPL